LGLLLQKGPFSVRKIKIFAFHYDNEHIYYSLLHLRLYSIQILRAKRVEVTLSLLLVQLRISKL
jgi:hypothetical protein